MDWKFQRSFGCSDRRGRCRPAGGARGSGSGVRRAAVSGVLTTADIQRLEDAAADASRDISQLPQRDESLRSQLTAALDDIRDETTYLKVKLKKGESVQRTEYFDLRDRVDDIRERARGGPAACPVPGAGDRSAAERPVIQAVGAAHRDPIGTEFDVRLQTTSARQPRRSKIDSKRPRWSIFVRTTGCWFLSSTMRGVVSSVNKAGRLDRKGSLTLAFDRITVDGQDYPLRATVSQALESEGVKGEAGRIGTGAGVGAIIGGILGGFKGVLAGILIGVAAPSRRPKARRRAPDRNRAARASRLAARPALTSRPDRGCHAQV